MAELYVMHPIGRICDASYWSELNVMHPIGQIISDASYWPNYKGKDIFIYPLQYSTLFGGMYRPTTGSHILIRDFYLGDTKILTHKNSITKNLIFFRRLRYAFRPDRTF